MKTQTKSETNGTESANGNWLVEGFDQKLTFPVLESVYETPLSAIPFGNIVAIVSKALRHKVSNEAYAGALSDVGDQAGITDSMSKDDKSAALKSFRESDDTKPIWEKAWLDRADTLWREVLEGELSADGRGDSVQTEYAKLVDKAVRALFAGAKDAEGKALKPPTNDKESVTFGDGESWSRAELRDFIKDTQGDELMTKAKAIVEARKVETPKAPTTPITTAASLGLRKRVQAEATA